MDEQALLQCVQRASNRLELWAYFLNAASVKAMAEVGVYRGEFAAFTLEHCKSITSYYMVDPWKHLEDWNKPANTNNETFESYFQETLQRTAFAENRRIILRGTTSEVIDKIPDKSLDFAYIDGDHTLRGITIDLINIYSKIRPGGYIGGDDFRPTIWDHPKEFEPTLIFPFAVHFAEAYGSKISALPGSQFLIEKPQAKAQFTFRDYTGKYKSTSLREQLS